MWKKYITLFVFFSIFVNSKELLEIDDLSPELSGQYVQVKKVLDDLENNYSDLEDVKKMIDSFIIQEQNFLPIYYEKVRMLHKSGYYGLNDIKALDKEAIAILNDMLLKDPTYAPAYYYLGVINNVLLNYDESEKMFLKSKDLNPLEPWLFNSYGLLKYRQNFFNESLELYQKGFLLSKNDIYALIRSLIWLLKLSDKTDLPNKNLEIINFIFDNYKEEKDRLKIAEKLIKQSGGRSINLTYANKIIKRHENGSENCTPCKVEMASLILKSGYKSTKNGVRKYQKKSIEEAEKILTSVKSNEKKLKLRVFEMLVDIALNDKNYDLAHKLIISARLNKLAEEAVELKYALFHFIQKDYGIVIEIFENLIKGNKSLLDDKIYLKALGRLERIKNRSNKGYDGLKKHYLRAIDRYPDSAYSYGNFVSFLLRYEKDSSNEAMKYGEKGLEIMPYGLLKKDMGLAYHIEATKLNSSEREKKVTLYKKSLSMGDIDYSKDWKCTYCMAYSAVQSYIKERRVVKESFFEKYSTYIKLGMISFLFLFVVLKLKEKRKNKI